MSEEIELENKSETFGIDNLTFRAIKNGAWWTVKVRSEKLEKWIRVMTHHQSKTMKEDDLMWRAYKKLHNAEN